MLVVVPPETIVGGGEDGRLLDVSTRPLITPVTVPEVTVTFGEPLVVVHVRVVSAETLSR